MTDIPPPPATPPERLTLRATADVNGASVEVTIGPVNLVNFARAFGYTVWYLATCQDCYSPAGPLAQPFSVEDERNEWAAAHSGATGHSVKLSVEIR